MNEPGFTHRTFELTPRDDGSTDFVMEERFSGILFALTRRMLPDFRPIFEACARDLKRAAEAARARFVEPDASPIPRHPK